MGRLGEIFRAHGEEYRARFGARMSLDQLRAMRSHCLTGVDTHQHDTRW